MLNQFPETATILVGSHENEREIQVDITEDIRERAYAEVMDDENLMYYVEKWLNDGHGVDMCSSIMWTDKWLTMCKLLRDNDEEFKAWWNAQMASRVANYAIELAVAHWENNQP